MKDLSAMLASWKTTLAGIVPLLVALLNQLGVWDMVPEEVDAAIAGVLDALIWLNGAVFAAIGLFSRDANKSSEDAGLNTPTKAA